jgi:hypothetical protein
MVLEYRLKEAVERPVVLPGANKWALRQRQSSPTLGAAARCSTAAAARRVTRCRAVDFCCNPPAVCWLCHPTRE